MAQRRITDAARARQPRRELVRLGTVYAPGDTDLSWTRLTLWRGLLAAALDQPPYEKVEHVTVTGASDSPSTDLLAGWLAETLRCPVLRTRTHAGTGMSSVRMERRSGNIDLVRADSPVATLIQPGQPQRQIGLHRRSIAECLAEELRRLEPDAVYQEALTRGLSQLAHTRTKTASEAIAEGQAPSLAEAKRARASAERRAGAASRAAKRATPSPRKRAAKKAR
jgi:glucose-6-phosphate dehydrogenase assembly protein OpcA